MLTPEHIVAEARTWLGTPYHLQACVKGVGVDCAMLLVGIARGCGMCSQPLPPRRYSPQWALHGARETLIEALETSGIVAAIPMAEVALADIIGFRWGAGMLSHVGIISCCAPWRMIHAMQGHCVVEVGVQAMWASARVAAWQWTGSVT